MSHNRCPVCGEDDWSDYGDMPCACYCGPTGPEPQMPEPTIEELCGPEHPYCGDDGDHGRCYCGAQRYPKGGEPREEGR